MVVTNKSIWLEQSFQTASSSSGSPNFISLYMPNTATAVAGEVCISDDSLGGPINTMCMTTFFFYIKNINWATGNATAWYADDIRYNFDQSVGAYPQNPVGGNPYIAFYVITNYNQDGTGQNPPATPSVSKVFVNYSYTCPS